MPLIASQLEVERAGALSLEPDNMLEKQMNAVHALEPITIVTTRSSDWQEVERDWVELTNRSPYASFFLCADWIGTWIETYRPCLDIEILRFFHGGQIVGACLLNQSTQDWYSRLHRKTGLHWVSATRVCQCRVVRFRLARSLLPFHSNPDT